jgi:hypothetical protein
MIRCLSWGRPAAYALWMGFCGALAAGCSHGASSGGGSVSCAQPSGCSTPGPGTTQLSTPTISFMNDVMPIFQTSCATSTLCHQGITGSTVPAMSLLYLGDGAGASTDPLLVYVALSAVASHELPTMSYVAPGDPTMSYLMHKMDGDMCQFTSQCDVLSASPIPCGVVMPVPCALPDAQRDVVRRWIAQGAQNN